MVTSSQISQNADSLSHNVPTKVSRMLKKEWESGETRPGHSSGRRTSCGGPRSRKALCMSTNSCCWIGNDQRCGTESLFSLVASHQPPSILARGSLLGKVLHEAASSTALHPSIEWAERRRPTHLSRSAAAEGKVITSSIEDVLCRGSTDSTSVRIFSDEPAHRTKKK